MIRLRKIIALVVLSYAHLLLPAQSATIYSNGGTLGTLEPSSSPIGLSDIGSDFRYASTFRLSSPDTVRSVTWSGGYENNILVPTDSFTISFYETVSDPSLGIIPSTLLQSYAVGNSVNRLDSGTDTDIRDIYTYAADIGDLPLMGSKLYYISIVNDTSLSSNTIWRWATGFRNGLTSAISTDGSVPTWISTDAFQNGLRADIDGTFTLNNTNLVPIPAAVWLFGSALGLLSLTYRKRQIQR